jgi:2-dehydropantoate 2-reductase
MRGNIGDIGAAPGGPEFLSRFLEEVIAVIGAVGKPVSDAAIALARSSLAPKGSSLTSSMYRDLEQNQPIEAEQIIGDWLARGRAAGVSTPLIAAAHTHLGVYQSRLTR